jgi:proteasome lid subunit RPN8/RPN11
MNYLRNSNMPSTQVPIIEFMQYKGLLHVKMNIKSTVLLPGVESILRHQGFVFSVQMKDLSLPESHCPEGCWSSSFELLLDIPINKNSLPEVRFIEGPHRIFHPHFKSPVGIMMILEDDCGKWIDYKSKQDDLEEDLGSYLLRIAHSINYERAYIKTDAKRIGNKKALAWYVQNCQSERFPMNDVQLPTKNDFEISSQESEAQGGMFVQRSLRQGIKFDVQELKPAYTPSENTQPNCDLKIEYNSTTRLGPTLSLSHKFYLKMSAFQAILDHIEWGNRTRDNVVEQGGLLLGDAFRDPDTGLIYAIAEQSISGKLAIGTSSYLEVTHETWKEMLDYVDSLDTDLQVIGWYHTHPNNLDVFMSGTDQATQSRLFGTDWQFAMVLNPHRKIWRVFYGADSRECRGYVADGDRFISP